MIVVALIILTALLVWRFGADSRDGRDWAPAALPDPPGEHPAHPSRAAGTVIQVRPGRPAAGPLARAS